MAWNEMTTTATPKTVFAILSEPHAYTADARHMSR